MSLNQNSNAFIEYCLEMLETGEHAGFEGVLEWANLSVREFVLICDYHNIAIPPCLVPFRKPKAPAGGQP